jgi:RHS repeat-associated protein
MKKPISVVLTIALVGQALFVPLSVSAQSPPSSVNYTYDQSGNLTYDGQRTITYDASGMPAKITKGQTEVTFVYDGSGARIAKIVKNSSGQLISSTIYFGNIEKETVGGTTTVTKYYFANGKRIALRKNNGEPLYITKDHLSSSTLFTDSSGSKKDSLLTYFPYGQQKSNWDLTDSTDLTDRLFTDQIKDAETELYYYNARYYNPQIGMFISPDKKDSKINSPTSLNRFAYVDNNPIGLVDPNGQDHIEPREMREFAIEMAQFFPPGSTEAKVAFLAAASPVILAGAYAGVLVGGAIVVPALKVALSPIGVYIAQKLAERAAAGQEAIQETISAAESAGVKVTQLETAGSGVGAYVRTLGTSGTEIVKGTTSFAQIEAAVPAKNAPVVAHELSTAGGHVGQILSAAVEPAGDLSTVCGSPLSVVRIVSEIQANWAGLTAGLRYGTTLSEAKWTLVNGLNIPAEGLGWYWGGRVAVGLLGPWAAPLGVNVVAGTETLIGWKVYKKLTTPVNPPAPPPSTFQYAPVTME